ncbi:thiamine-triphosphatase isoform X2 [Nematolebias whitei]|nr:thiamine-triphosphatase isoform X2 [Nematolebias whitei]
MTVEVERKFVFSAETLETLESIGVCVDQRQFHDQYFDTPEFNLTLRDMWLRKRKGCWELKCPMANSAEEPSEERPADAALCTHYKEISSLSEIYQRVKEVIKVDCEDREAETTPSQEDCSWLSKLNLACFAEFTTTRRSFTLGEEGVKIDLDQADFGHHVGEIEVLIPEGGDVQLAQEKIRNAAKKLGVSGDERVDGKMTTYLKRYRPEHYAALLRARVL